MQSRMMQRIKDTQQNQPGRSNRSKHQAEPTKHLFCCSGILREAAIVSQPALGDEGQVKKDGCYAGASDEERLEGLRADV